MKKIMGVALVAALVATSVFAQVSTSLEFRQGINIADIDIKKDKDNVYNIFKQSHSPATNTTFSASTDHAGVNIELDFNLNTKEIEFGYLYGWFSVGGFKLTAGKYDSRFTDRLVKDRTRALSLSKLFNEYGVQIPDDKSRSGGEHHINVDGTKKGDNMTNGSDLATIADYTFDLDFAKLLVKGALFTPEFNSIMKSGFGFEAAFQMDLFTIDFAVKFPTAYNTSLGLYFQMKPVDLLQFAIGATLGIVSAQDEKPLVYGIDGRVRLTPLDALAITVHANFSGGVLSSDVVKNTEYWFGAVANVTYDINDMFAIFGEAKYDGLNIVYTSIAGSLSKPVDKSGSVFAQLGTLIRPVENVKLAASVQAEIPTKATSGATVAKISIPFVFDVSF